VILVTGANGFIGRALCAELHNRHYKVRGVVRQLDSNKDSDILALGDINAYTDWVSVLNGVNSIIHCAARTHVMYETKANSILAYQSVNVDGTYRLAKQAAVAGVRRFVYISSIKVNDESICGSSRRFITSSDNVNADLTNLVSSEPVDAYTASKCEAEQILWDVSAKTGLEVVIVRPPLVYGPGVKGNMARLLSLVRSGIPLPLGAIKNKRSLIGLDNIIDLLIRCVEHPAAKAQTLLVSDGEDLSTPDLLTKMSAALGRSPRLFSVPVPLLCHISRYLGKRAEIDRLVGSLCIDSSYSGKLLDWEPVISVTEGIRRMVQY